MRLKLCLLSFLFITSLAAEPESEEKAAPKESVSGNDHETEGVSPQAANSEEPNPTEEKLEPSFTGEWCGKRKCLQKNGLIIQSTLVLDGTWNLFGGRRQNSDPSKQYWFDINFTLISDKLFHYKGGTWFFDFQSHRGEHPSDQLVGSFVNLDTIEARPLDQIASLWYKQAFGPQYEHWILAGKSDAYENFTRTTYSLLFINGAYNMLPTILFLPTYPDPAMSLLAHLGFPCDVALTLGLFDGSLANGFHTGQAGLFGHFFHHLDHHAFFIGQLDIDWEMAAKKKGRLGVGAWHHTAHFERFRGGHLNGTGGFYATLDQLLYKNKQTQIGLFCLVGFADPEVSAVHYYAGAGVVWEGLPCRAEDALGIGVSYSCFTDIHGHTPFARHEGNFFYPYETFYEVFYKWQICRWGFLQPDFQYVVHPSGHAHGRPLRHLPNAFALTLRFQANL